MLIDRHTRQLERSRLTDGDINIGISIDESGTTEKMRVASYGTSRNRDNGVDIATADFFFIVSSHQPMQSRSFFLLADIRPMTED